MSRQLPTIRLDRSALLDFGSTLGHEWLVSNGLGGYASGIVLGVETRCYHGLLVAALRPPTGRTLLLARLHHQIGTSDISYPLHTAEYYDGIIDHRGHLFLVEFQLDGILPTWRYRRGDAALEKTLWLAHRPKTVFIRYRVLMARGRLTLRIEPFTAHRDYHAQTRGALQWRFAAEPRADRWRV